MKVRDLMTQSVVKIEAGESVDAAARTLTHYNIGMLPVCSADGRLCGLVTDRDLVTRCVAAGKSPGETKVREVMTGRVVSVSPDMEIGAAAHLMGKQQVRRLPVTENGKLCGIISLGDMAQREDSIMDAADALGDISDPLSHPTSWQ